MAAHSVFLMSCTFSARVSTKFRLQIQQTRCLRGARVKEFRVLTKKAVVENSFLGQKQDEVILRDTLVVEKEECATKFNQLQGEGQASRWAKISGSGSNFPEVAKRTPRGPVTAENASTRIAEVMTPLYKVSYEEQLKVKYQMNFHVLSKLNWQLRKVNTHLKSWKGLPCRLLPVQPSPITEAYRNKDEFSVRPGPDGSPKTVGFFTESPALGNPVCVRGDDLINMREKHKSLARLYENYIKASPLPSCDRLDDGGYWRNLLVRSNEKGDTMVIVIFHPQEMSADRIDEEKQKLRDYFVQQDCGLTSLYFQACQHTRCTNQQAPFELLYGEPYLVEELGNLKFRISPESFFQINTQAAGVLYETVKKVSGVSKMSTVLDVCCGTGTISCFLAPHVRGTIGVEKVVDAVKDARANAQMNGIFNAEFFAGRAEKKLPGLLQDLQTAPDIVAMINPSRAGLHPALVDTIRSCSQIHRLVYISCKPEGDAMRNFVSLCQEHKKQKSLPFMPVVAVPVDLFPHTHHCELIVVFERR